MKSRHDPRAITEEPIGVDFEGAALARAFQ